VPQQPSLICTICPLLPDCNEESLFCALRWATDPNAAQKNVLTLVAKKSALAVKMAVAKRPDGDRKQYYKNYYIANRDRKLKAANERNRDAK
jgi:hypothetical protein